MTSLRVVAEKTFKGFPVELRTAGPFGRGLFSTRDIKRGDVVFIESPLYKGSYESGKNYFGKNTRLSKDELTILDLVRSFLDQKLEPNEDFEDWFELEFAASQSFVLENDNIFKILQTHNGCDYSRFLEVWNRVQTNCVFDGETLTCEWWLGASLSNHSCFPNIWNQGPVNKAFVDIKQGEQIFRGYNIPPNSRDLKLHGMDCKFDGIWEDCLCFKGGPFPRHEAQLVDIYILNMICTNAGVLGYDDGDVESKLNSAYCELQTEFPSRRWNTKHDEKLLDWVDEWSRKLGKGKWSRLLSRIFS